MKFTKAELKVIHNNLFHQLAMLNTIWPRPEETKIIESILNKISKRTLHLPTGHHD